MNKNDNSDYSIYSGNALFVIAFIIPVVVLFAIYLTRGIYPFGDQMYLRSDMYHQYAPFYSELMDKLKNGKSLTYTWNIGLGVNFTALYAYYLSSPVNWFLGLMPQNHLPEIMSIFITLKLALASVTTCYYISKKYNTKNIAISLFGLFYSLSAYIAAFSWNIMWLDCIMIFPIVMMGIERLMKENNGFLYSISLGFCILSNYYISIMVCLFLIIYFFVLYFMLEERSFKIFIQKGLKFAGYSLLAGGLSCVLLFPEIYALSLTASSDMSFPSSLSNYFSITEMLIRHLMDVPVSIGLDHLPNIYCGVAVFLLFPLYIMNKNITTRKKVLFTSMLVIFLTAFNFNIPNYIWHGLHYPNSLPCRQSFIYIFVILIMCYEALRDIKNYTNKQLTCAFWIAIAFLLYSEQTYVSDDFNFKIIYLSGAFIAFYMLLMYIYRKKKIAIHFVIFLLFVSTIGECMLNLEDTGYSTTGRTSYLSDNEAITNLTNNIMESDDSFYRFAKYDGYRSKNDTAWHHINGVSLFSSTANAGVTSFLGALGCEHSTNSYSYNGATPLTSAMLSTKYVLAKSIMTESELLRFVDAEGGVNVYENMYTLPLGYMVPSYLNDSWNTDMTNPFDVQNAFLELAAGESNVFTPVEYDTTGTTVTITPDHDENIYLYVTDSDVDKITVTCNGKTTNYKSIKREHIVDLGICNALDTITITAEDNADITLMAYTMDTDAFINAIELLNEGGLNITKFDDTYIKGTITADNDQTMITSIPYDEGWAVYVDGKRADYYSFEDAFIAVDLEAGEHTITMDYIPCGFEFGWFITGISAIILLILYVFSRKKMGLSPLPFMKKSAVAITDTKASTNANTASEKAVIDSKKTTKPNTGIEQKTNTKPNTDMNTKILKEDIHKDNDKLSDNTDNNQY
ncbi:YfhO family protein [Falcatimonas sp. MSJ-15]|uniref:YfhO family protein n=1 Tax=Falcatimonas sp. MSJ-15 TaxID=2841515 RepID=UPI001C0F8E2C|nr:YfhO family protein [Falcatimonas sp. MSJ-15]MBU5468911.1 YfhO family protein [Falcatimonas sp. MSJ-15]